MPRRIHRLLLPLAALALLGGLAACGDEASEPEEAAVDSAPTSSSAPTADDDAALDQVTVTGKFGAEPTVVFDSEVAVSGVVSSAVTEGKGEELAAGDAVFGQVWIGNGQTKQKVFSTHDQKTPELLTLSEQLLPALNQSLVGQRVGSRVLVISAPGLAYGEQGNPSIGLGNADSVVFVVDLVSTIADGPEGADRTPATWAPAIVEEEGQPTALDFDGAPEPSGKLQRTTLIQGSGPAAKKGDHVYVNYLGQVSGGDEPFDESYSTGTPFDFDLGAGSVVKGWDQGLVGVKVGSRVILQVPPSLGYGEAGQPSVGISGTDTMYFVVDVLAVT